MNILYKLALALVGVVAILSISVASAAGSVQISGRVYQSGSNAGYANAAVYLCGSNGYAYTDEHGSWHATVESGAGYCARVVGGVPASEVADAVANNPEVGRSQTYEYQYAGRNCYHSSSCSDEGKRWDRTSDSGVDFALGPAATATPAAKSGAGGVVKSDDGVATAQVPAGASCVVVGALNLRKTTWGPYLLKCKDAGAAAMIVKSATWTFNLGNRASQYRSFSAVAVDAHGKAKAVSGAVHDQKAQTVSFSADGSEAAGVQGSKFRAPLFYALLIVGAVIFGGMTALQWWRGRRARETSDTKH